jgi:excisionase family DNA binding protein
MADADRLPVSEAAEALSASTQTIRNWIRGDRLHGVRIGNRFLIPRAEVEQLRGDVGSSVGETPWAEQASQEAREAWRAALRGHVLTPPDAGFSARLAVLAAAASQRAAACETAHGDGFEWPPARGGARPPYELQPASGRRGPSELWERFDEAVAKVDRVSEGRSLRAVARARAELGDVADQLRSGCRTRGPRQRAVAAGPHAAQVGVAAGARGQLATLVRPSRTAAWEGDQGTDGRPIRA